MANKPQPVNQPRASQAQRSSVGFQAFVGAKPSQIRRPQADTPRAPQAKPPQPNYPSPRIGAAKPTYRNVTAPAIVQPQNIGPKQPPRRQPEQVGQAPRRVVSTPTKPLQEQGRVQIGGSPRMAFTNDQSGMVKPANGLRIRRPSPQKP